MRTPAQVICTTVSIKGAVLFIYLRITFRQNNAFVIIYEHILDLKILPNIFRINLPDELAEISCYSERVE
jgi:hypothetical protein